MKKTPLALVLLAWAIVAVPLGWGLYKSVVKSWPLFQVSAPPITCADRGHAAVPLW